MLDIACGTNEMKESVDLSRSTEDSDYLPSNHTHTSYSELNYTCGPGRRFSNDSGVTRYDHLNYTCQETVGGQMANCVIDNVQCPLDNLPARAIPHNIYQIL